MTYTTIKGIDNMILNIPFITIHEMAHAYNNMYNSFYNYTTFLKMSMCIQNHSRS